MKDRNELIDEIVNIEWKMFSTVNNAGGQASCQRRPDTFYIMRSSQFLAWPAEILQSYYEDVKAAEAAHRNICTEKYGYMMEFTVPDEYAAIKNALPAVAGEKLAKIREMTDINLEWEETVAENYPRMRGNGRPLRSKDDSVNFVSVETYFSCELKTYSEKTIDLLYDYTLSCKARGVNMAMQILENTAKAYGYESLEAAEARL